MNLSPVGRRRVRQGPIEIYELAHDQLGKSSDETSLALVVNYFEETDTDREQVLKKKIVKIKASRLDQDLPELAQEIVQKCKYISNSRIHEVEDIISKLRDQHVAEVSKYGILTSSHLDELPSYVEQLYEDDQDKKIQAARRLLALFTDLRNLQPLVQHETLLPTLARFLKDESKLSTEFCLALTSCFFILSSYREFRPVLTNHQCGDVCLRILEFESRRFEIRIKEYKEEIKNATYFSIRRQSHLVHLLILALDNLASESQIEKKMISRNIIELLIKFLTSPNEELQISILNFLKKLSITQQNVEIMLKNSIFDQLLPLQPRTTNISLRLIHNLAFHSETRAVLLELSFVESLVELLIKNVSRFYVIRLLYLFSRNDQSKLTIAEAPNCLEVLVQLAIHFPGNRVGIDLMALLINLATVDEICSRILELESLPEILTRSIEKQDQLVIKFVRNLLASSEKTEKFIEKLLKPPWIQEYIRLGISGDLFLRIEILNLLSELHEAHKLVDWPSLAKQGLWQFLEESILHEDENLLGLGLRVAGTAGMSQEIVDGVVNSKILRNLSRILIEKSSDEEISLNGVYLVNVLLYHDSTRRILLEDHELLEYLLHLLRDKNCLMREITNRTLSLVVLGSSGENDFEVSFIDRVKDTRFGFHNSRWIHATGN